MQKHLSYTVHVLLSERDGKFHIGFTNNLYRRLYEHEHGKVTSTKGRRSFRLIYHACYQNKFDALRRERYIKATVGKRVLRLMLRENLAS